VVRGFLVAVGLAILVAAPARASAEAKTGVIALLPLAADSKLALYGQPVASEVARSLERDGFSVVLVTSTAPVPSKARLVIDGRIVRGTGGAVLLEARVRDPEAGTVVAELSATAASLTRIDEAATELAGSLSKVLETGLAAQAEAKRAPKVEPAKNPGSGTVESAPAKVDTRPLALVSMTSSVAVGADDPAVEPLLRAGAVRLAGLIGHRSDDLREEGVADLGAALTAQQAALIVRIELLSMRYENGGVITARARARVRVIAADGTVFDRIVRTDTLVGGRGDRRDAVARAAVDQIVDIAMPRVRERLEPK
jgi:hypothetical protein